MSSNAFVPGHCERITDHDLYGPSFDDAIGPIPRRCRYVVKKTALPFTDCVSQRNVPPGRRPLWTPQLLAISMVQHKVPRGSESRCAESSPFGDFLCLSSPPRLVLCHTVRQLRPMSGEDLAFPSFALKPPVLRSVKLRSASTHSGFIGLPRSAIWRR